MTTNYLRVLCVVAGLQAAAVAQVAWVQVASTGPSGRTQHAMAYDSQRGRTVLFGGSGSNGASLGDTWEWNGTAWQSLAFVPGPSARSGQAMVFDTPRRRVVLFGGSDNTGYIGDTWEWNGIAWTQVASAGPSARNRHAMAYDSQRGRTVMFGGYNYYGGLVYLGDTWEWNGITWTQVASTGPTARYGHAMACDSQRGKTVLFGGYIGSNLGDTWEWDGITWTLVASTGPTARYGHAMAYDSFRGRTVMFGGSSVSTTVSDTWEWNGITWFQVSASGPAPRNSHAMAYDSQRESTFLFGGSYANDSWKWRGGLVAAAYAFGAGCGNPALTLTPVSGLPPRIGTTAQVTVANVPANLTFVALGFSSTNSGPVSLPLSLAQFGMPGCDLLQSADVNSSATMTGPSTASYSLPLPNWSGLIGLVLYLQGWAIAPGANPGNTIVSNGVYWLIGNN